MHLLFLSELVRIGDPKVGQSRFKSDYKNFKI